MGKVRGSGGGEKTRLERRQGWREDKAGEKTRLDVEKESGMSVGE